MAYDEILAERIRQALARKKNIEEKKMFGCICFFVNGNALVCRSTDSCNHICPVILAAYLRFFRGGTRWARSERGCFQPSSVCK